MEDTQIKKKYFFNNDKTNNQWSM